MINRKSKIDSVQVIKPDARLDKNPNETRSQLCVWPSGSDPYCLGSKCLEVLHVACHGFNSQLNY